MLAAARRVFAREGLDAPLDAIAREAGVARATQHRHFPTRESLVRAIFDDNLDELARDRGFVDLFNHRSVADDVKQDIADRFLAIVAEPLAAAQAARRVRGDLELEDTILLVDMLGAAVGLTGPGRPDRRRDRAIALVLDAIAAPEASA
jgi:AcrR family transcriptional regulator